MPKILIVTSAFFPFPGVAAVRVTNWVKMFSALGWECIVVAKDYGHRIGKVDYETSGFENVKIYAFDTHFRVKSIIEHSESKSKKKNVGNNSKYKTKLKLMLNSFFVPDAQILFWRKLIKQISSIVKEHEPDIIITTSPPHSVHSVGMRIKREWRIPWIADFRDPYTIDPRFGSKRFGRLLRPWHHRFERNIYRNASLITHAIPLHERWAKEKHPSLKEKCHLLPHVIPVLEVDPFDSLLEGKHPERPETFRLKIVGKYGKKQLEELSSALKYFVENNDIKVDVKLEIVGDIPSNMNELNARAGGRIIAKGRMPHSSAIKEMSSASVLLNLLDEERQNTLGISSKLFEYAQFGVPILVVNPTRPDKALLKELPMTYILHKPTALHFSKQLFQIYTDHLENKVAFKEERSAFLERYGWKKHAASIQHLILKACRCDGRIYEHYM